MICRKFSTMVVAAMLLAAACSAEQSGTDRSADIEAFRTGMVEVDQSFPPGGRETALHMLDELTETASGLSDAEFELALARIAATTGNGHSTLYAGGWADRYNRLGVRFYILDDALYVADAQPPYEDLVGHRVETLEESSLLKLRRFWRDYQKGTVGYRDQTLYNLIESPEVFHAAGLAASAESISLTLDDGRTVTVGTSEAWPAEEGIWTVLPQAREIQLAGRGRISGDPLYLRDPEAFVRMEMVGDDTAYVQFRGNVDFSGRLDMAEESDRLTAELQAAAPRFIVVDQRFNLGGDLNTTRDMMQALPDIVGPDGHIVVITSGRTFSAAIASTGYLKQAGGDRVTIVGRPVGDSLEFWAEGSPVALPGNGAYIGVATERHNYMTGCPEADCHAPIRNHPIRIETLAPDIEPVRAFDDIMNGGDACLDAALAVFRGVSGG